MGDGSNRGLAVSGLRRLPIRSRRRWGEAKRRWPELFAEAVDIDARMRGGQADGSGNECAGHCGVRGRPEMAFQLHRFAETLSGPDAVRPAKSSPTVELYYRLYPDLQGRNRYVCLVVKRESS